MNILSSFKSIKLIAMDVDGVLTDGQLILFPNFDFSYGRNMNIKDGFAIQLAIKKGYHLMVISGAQHDNAVENRLKKLGLTDLHMGVSDKSAVLTKAIDKFGLQKSEVLFIGDDVPDISALKTAGLACCPADAVDDVKEICSYISHIPGGMGCVRDVIEKVLRLNNHWDIHLEISAK